MKQVSSTLWEKLRQYSLLVSPLLASPVTAGAQVMYHDIDPDKVYTDATIGDNYAVPEQLDLDNDGVYDMEFAVWSSAQSDNGPNKVNLAGVRQLGGNGNAMMGYTNLFSATICSTPLPLYCASALNVNKMIEPGANFWALPGTNSLGTLVRYFRNVAPPNNFVGQWNNLADRFIGLRFTGGDGNLHYGWMRMDVSKSPASVTIKDYAYEKQNNAAIQAGDKGNVGLADADIFPGFNLFINNGILTILINDPKFDDATVTIVNIVGRLLISQPLNHSSNEINLNPFGTGLYVLTIHHDEESFSRKIFLAF